MTVFEIEYASNVHRIIKDSLDQKIFDEEFLGLQS